MGGGSIVVSGQGTELIVASCKFKNNQAGYAGGAIMVQTNAIAFIESSLFDENSATGGETSYGGGAIYVPSTGTVTIASTQFRNNTAKGQSHGGAIRVDGGGKVILSGGDNVFEATNSAGTGNMIYMGKGDVFSLFSSALGELEVDLCGPGSSARPTYASTSSSDALPPPC